MLNFSRCDLEAFGFLRFAAEQEAVFLVGAQHKTSCQFCHMLILIFFNEHADDFHHGSERMVFIFTHFVHEPVQLLHKLAVFAVIVRHA